MKIAVYAVGAVMALGYFFCLRGTEKPVRTFLRSALGGVASLMAVNILSGWTTVGIEINGVTVGCSALLGPAGTILTLLVRMFAGI